MQIVGTPHHAAPGASGRTRSLRLRPTSGQRDHCLTPADAPFGRLGYEHPREKQRTAYRAYKVKTIGFPKLGVPSWGLILRESY